MSQQSLDRRFFESLEWAQWAVNCWSEFPAHEVPRPLVLAGQHVLVEGGFSSGEAKMAFLDGHIEWNVDVPEDVRSALDTAQAKQAPRRSNPPIVILSAVRGHTQFVTDRGPKRLAAWQLQADGGHGAIWVLDPDMQPWRPRLGACGSPPHLQSPAQDPFAQIEVEADQQSVVVHWLGSPPEYETYPVAHPSSPKQPSR